MEKDTKTVLITSDKNLADKKAEEVDGKVEQYWYNTKLFYHVEVEKKTQKDQELGTFS